MIGAVQTLEWVTIIVKLFLLVHRLAEDNKIPSAKDTAVYQSLIKEAQKEIIRQGYDIGEALVLCSCIHMNAVRIKLITDIVCFAINFYLLVLCTCNEASSSRVTQNIAPVQVIIDEAAMATEPESMAAVKLAIENVTLIGDHMQLQVRCLSWNMDL